MPTNNIPPWNSSYTFPSDYRICNCIGNGCMDTTPATTTTVVCPPHDYVQGERGRAGYVFCRRCADCKELLIGAE